MINHTLLGLEAFSYDAEVDTRKGMKVVHDDAWEDSDDEEKNAKEDLERKVMADMLKGKGIGKEAEKMASKNA